VRAFPEGVVARTLGLSGKVGGPNHIAAGRGQLATWASLVVTAATRREVATRHWFTECGILTD